ncbi:hypothetical protein [Staphylococcus capitis]|uniref:Uncharacterized protein n=1 Tax=Staphylococcus capitis TaxID=29388 RepID=A0A7Z7YWY6_STACP|nr:hypothetical protein [Staphylococcus capitis]MBC8779499.1 hypothetical protein [Staphylococcus capitis]MBE7321520.1 hypothetical protein [Staphylococcus capitis]MBU5290417.1 hypothetical protein [Staphylococcus capitis]MCC3691263.1 hypothetical protein [Staphylococcus capitis]MCC3695315.1 hypothetical protein [Staphylococcus capitis]
MDSHNQCNYVNPNSVSLDWECFIISKTDMLLDGVPKELINEWLDKDLIEPFSIRNNEVNFKTKDVWEALNTHNWYYSN